MAEGQSMTVADVVAKTMDGRLEDFVREAVVLVARELMEGEISAEIGAAFGEVTPEARLTHRNGYRPRAWETRVGEIELLVPKKRSGSSYFPSFLEPRWRSEQAIVAVVLEAYVNGVSPRSTRVGKFVISIEDGLSEQVTSTSAVVKKLAIAIPDAVSEQVTGTSGVVKKLVIAIPDAVSEQVTSTSAVAKQLVIAIPDAVSEQVTSTSGVVKKLVIAIEDAVSGEVTGTAAVAKKITVSGVEMADRFVRLEHNVLRGLIEGAARPLVVQKGTKHRAAK